MWNRLQFFPIKVNHHITKIFQGCSHTLFACNLSSSRNFLFKIWAILYICSPEKSIALSRFIFDNFRKNGRFHSFPIGWRWNISEFFEDFKFRLHMCVLILHNPMLWSSMTQLHLHFWYSPILFQPKLFFLTYLNKIPERTEMNN